MALPRDDLLPLDRAGREHRRVGRRSAAVLHLFAGTPRKGVRPMKMSLAGRDLIDGAELCRRMQVGRTTVWRLAKLGRIPYYVVGRRWLFDEREVLAALRVAEIRKRPANDTQLPPRDDDNPSE